jgi:hypothetical protein
VTGQSSITVTVNQSGAPWSNRLAAGEYLYPGQSRTSPSGEFSLTFQDDGNLVLKDNGAVVSYSKGSNYCGGCGQYAAMQSNDGNFVAYDYTGYTWATFTTGAGNYLTVEDDGTLIIWRSNGSFLQYVYLPY